MDFDRFISPPPEKRDKDKAITTIRIPQTTKPIEPIGEQGNKNDVVISPEKNRDSILNKLDSTSDRTERIALIRSFTATGGALEELRSRYTSIITESESNPDRVLNEGLQELIDIEQERLDAVHNITSQLKTPITKEMMKKLLEGYVDSHKDGELSDISLADTDFSSWDPEMATTQLHNIQEAQTEIYEAQRLEQVETYKGIVESYLQSEEGRKLVTDGSTLLKEKQAVLENLGIPPECLAEVSNIFDQALQSEVSLIQEEEKKEILINRQKLVLTGVLMAMDPHFREEMIGKWATENALLPLMKRIGFSESDLLTAEQIYKPTWELLRLPAKNLIQLLPSLSDRQLFSMMQGMSEHERIALINEKTYKGSELSERAVTRLEEYASRLTPHEKKVLHLNSV